MYGNDECTPHPCVHVQHMCQQLQELMRGRTSIASRS